MEKVKLKKVYITDKKRDGTKLISKYDKPYQKIAIKTETHGDKWLSAFIHSSEDPMLEWQDGDEVEIQVEQKGEYLNFEIPKPADVGSEAIEALQKQIDELTGRVSALEAGEVFSKKDNSPADSGDEFPF